MAVDVSYSYQNKSTDTIGGNFDNKPYRDAAGQLVLGQEDTWCWLKIWIIGSWYCFYKNIDNVIQNNIDKILIKKGWQVFYYPYSKMF
jgi:hypothetical protein